MPFGSIGSIETDSPDHFAVVRISGNNGMFAGLKCCQRLIAKQKTESAFLPDAPVAGDTVLIDNGFYLTGEIDGFPPGADHENQSSQEQDRYGKQHFLHIRPHKSMKVWKTGSLEV